jgi:hypothetical protein
MNLPILRKAICALQSPYAVSLLLPLVLFPFLPVKTSRYLNLTLPLIVCTMRIGSGTRVTIKLHNHGKA